MRTYAGHSSAKESNALYRRNLAKGQTGLSVAFDLPTQIGYDADHVLARGEVGRVGVPVAHLGDMRALFDGIPLEQTNTSMTINATAMWLLALYQVAAEEQGADIAKLTGTTQNDIVKEYLSRGTYVFPPGPVGAPDHRRDRLHGGPHAQVEPDQRLQLPPPGGRGHPGAGDRVRAVPPRRRSSTPCATPGRSRRNEWARSWRASPSSSTRASASSRRCARCGRSPGSGTRITRERYGIADPALRRFRYGVQVNSLGLTEAQPENNVQRIVLEMLAVTLSKDARARAVQLPAWNEALGLPRPWDQQWSLRIQQVLAYESDLLEYGDLFDGSPVVEAKTAELIAGAAGGDRRGGRARRDGTGGGIRLPQGPARRLARGAARTHRVGRGKGRGGQLLPGHRAQSPHGERRGQRSTT